MKNNGYLILVANIENTEENGFAFDEMVQAIKGGEPASIICDLEMYEDFNLKKEPITYRQVVENILEYDERIIYDDGEYLIAMHDDFLIVLYEWVYAHDKLNNALNLGDEILWVNPDEVARDLNRPWIITSIPSIDKVRITSDVYFHSEEEVPASEVILKSVIG